MECITSLTNHRVKDVVLYVGKAKERRRADVYVVEGTKMFMEAQTQELSEVFVSEQLLARADEELLVRIKQLDGLPGVCVWQVTDEILRKMSDTQSPQGILCVLKQKHYELNELLQTENPLFVVLEDLQDPGNLGTILRTGEGAGITGVILSKDSVDIYNPKTIRSTMGSIYRVPFVYVENLEEVVHELGKRGIVTYAAHLKGEKTYDGFSYRKGCAFLIGNEGNGLREQTAALADHFLKIPMRGNVESLNAAIATAVLMYEAAKQRGFS